MKNKIKIITLLLGFLNTNVFANNVKPLSEPGTIYFTENKGQVHDLLNNPNYNVLFTSNSGPFTVHFKRNGIAYQLAKIEETTNTSMYKTNSLKSNKDKAESINISLSKVELSWLNSNSNISITTDEALDAFDNYYLPSCPNGALNVKSYRGITMHNLYKGIDVHYYEKNGQLKHDYIVAPNSDFSKIKIKIEGAIIEKSKNGAIIIKTNIGTIEESAPISFQGGKQLESHWIINGNELSFEIKNYNPNLELIIDPLTRAWGCYLGGNLTETGLECVTDASGNVYMTGTTASASNIASPNAQVQNLSGARDTYIIKYDFNGNRMYSSYFGGSGEETNSQIALYPNNQYFAITGLTTSSNVIGQSSPIQPLFGGGLNDNYLAVFNSSNGFKVWGTFIGGNDDEYQSEIACSITNNVVRIHVIGQTHSPNNISTPGTYKATITNTTATDAFLQTYTTTTTGSNPNKIMGTYYGGSGAESFYDIDLDIQGNIYLFGATNSTNGIAISAYQNTIAGIQDCFYTKWDANLSSPLYSSYFGGTDIDYANSICVNKNTGDFYIAGESFSQNLATNGTIKPQSTASGTAIADSYIAKISGNNGNKQICSYFGGSDYNAINSVKIDNVDDIWIGGYTSSTNNIASNTAINNTNVGGGGFLAKLTPSLNTQLYGTYYGGTGYDGINGITLNNTGNPNIVWVCGTTNSNDFISYSNPISQSTLGGSYDAFIGKIENPCSFSVALGAGTSTTVCESGQININLSNTSGLSSVLWTAPNTSTYATTNLTISNVNLSNSGTYNGLLTFNNGCIGNISHTVIVNPKPTIQINSNAAICTGKSYTISPGATNQYTVYSLGTTIGSGTSIVVSPTNATTQYSIVGVNSFNCVNSTTMNITVTQSLLVTNQSSSQVAFNVFSTAKLFVTANLQNIQYQWQIDTSSTTTNKFVDLSNSSKYNGVNTDTLRVNNINFNDNNKNFRCKLISTDCGFSNNSNTIKLTVGINIEVGIDEYNSKIVIFPNPAKTELFINTPEYFLGSHVRVFDAIGKLQLEQELINTSLYLNIKDWVNGMYTITIPETGKCFKLIKE